MLSRSRLSPSLVWSIDGVMGRRFRNNMIGQPNWCDLAFIRIAEDLPMGDMNLYERNLFQATHRAMRLERLGVRDA